MAKKAKDTLNTLYTERSTLKTTKADTLLEQIRKELAPLLPIPAGSESCKGAKGKCPVPLDLKPGNPMHGIKCIWYKKGGRKDRTKFLKLLDELKKVLSDMPLHISRVDLTDKEALKRLKESKKVAKAAAKGK
jgi:hypothetical protein